MTHGLEGNMHSKAAEDQLHKQVVDQLIVATPEWWNYARLELNYTSVDGIDKCGHCIINPQFPCDYVEPTEELYEATRKLVLYYKGSGSMWKSASYETWPEDEKGWKFKAEFQY